MISTLGSVKVTDNESYQAVVLPFSRSHLEFIAVMPKNSDSFYGFETAKGSQTTWNSKFWFEVLSRVESGYGRVKLPKFSFDYEVAMKDENDKLVQELGLAGLFSKFANFSKMATPGSVKSKVGIIKQKTRIELDEKGLKAAAATLVGGVEVTSVLPRTPKFDLVFNKPFYFAIYDREVNSFLFLGNLVDLSK